MFTGFRCQGYHYKMDPGSKSQLLLLYLMMKQRNQAQRRLRIEQFHHRQCKERLLLLLAFIVVHINQHLFVERTIWTKNRSSEWWDNVAMRFTQDEWKENFRVSPETFTSLCNELKFSLGHVDTSMRHAFSVEKRVTIAL